MASLVELCRTELADERLVVLVNLGDVFLQVFHQSKFLKEIDFESILKLLKIYWGLEY